MSSETISMTHDLYEYLHKVSLREPEILKKLRIETQKLPLGAMQISPEQGQLMGLLIELLNAKKTLDIGTFTGYSALVVALALPADGQVITCDLNTKFTNIAQKFWEEAKVKDKISLHLAPAAETLQKLIDQGEASTFDFAFIDADKNNYETYYEQSLQLLRRGGLIALDNVLWGGSVADEHSTDPTTKMFRKLNLKLLNDERVSISMIPIGDGLTLTRKR